jgi:hypothetical protein
VVSFISPRNTTTTQGPTPMYASRNKQPHQQKAIAKKATNQDGYSFFNLLTAPELLDTIEALLPPHRERQFPPTETLAMFLAQAMNPDRSCQRAVNDAATSRVIAGLKPCSTFTGAYCKARQRLPLEMVRALVTDTGKLIDQKVPDAWRWRGRPVRIIDGTTVSLPDTPQNQAIYPQQNGQKPGLGFPVCRIVGITCLSSGAVLNAAMGPFKGKGGSEHALLRSLLDTFIAGDILLGDALYGSYFLLAECQARHLDVVFEQNGARKRKTDFRTGKKIGSKDHLVRLTKPKQRPDWMSEEQYQAFPGEIMLRETGASKKILITTLMDPIAHPAEALKSLYRSRWHVELDIRNIKTTLGMDTLSCKTPEMAEKEMWVHLLAYNLIRLIMAQSASMACVLPRTLSFKHTLQLWLAWGRQPFPTYTAEQLDKLLRLVAEKRVGNRPGRIEPREVKRRPKPSRLMLVPRHQAQAQVRKNGHPPRQRKWNKNSAKDVQVRSTGT